MSLEECLNSAVEQGAINTRQRDEMLSYYKARFRSKRGGMDDAAAARAARDEVAAQLREEAREKARRAVLSENARRQIAERLKDGRNIVRPRNALGFKSNILDAALTEIVHYGYAGKSSMIGRSNGIVAMAQRDLADAMVHFRRTVGTGRRMNRADLPDLVRELHGEATGRPEIKALASAFGKVFEDLRLRFNAAGGAIPQRQDWGLPHSHDARAIRALGRTADEQRTAWKAIIRPLIDPDQMVHPVTGAPVGEAGIDEALDHSFASIVSEGWAHRKAQARPFGQGALADRYKDGRFLVFRDAASWLAYNEKFGRKDPIGAMFDQVKRLADDIAAMEQFGPNPDATVEWMKQTVQSEIGKAQAGLPSIVEAMLPPSVDAGKRAAYRIESLWRHARGRETVWNGPALIAADVRNVATSSMLGSTPILAASTDPFIAAASRRLAGLDMTRTTQKMIQSMRNIEDRRALARAGVIWQDYLHSMNDQARFADQVFGHEWSRYMVDRALTWNALKPMTEARQRVEALAWHETLGKRAAANTDWIDLDQRLQRTMQGFGFTPDDWHAMRAGVDEAGFLSPGSLLERTGNRELAERYAEMVAMWSERAVPSGSIEFKSLLSGVSPRGTVTGEMIDFAAQFMSFGMSFTARQMEAHYIASLSGKGGRAMRGAAYFTALSVPLMLGAAAYMQILALLDGKDPIDMTTPGFWTTAFVKGGGGGLFADFISKSESRFGSSLQETLSGPGIAFVGDSFDITVGNIMRVLRGDIEQKKLARQVTGYVGRYTPVMSSHPATRLAYRRYFVDNLQRALDPEADASFKAKRKAAAYWFEPGTSAPRRPPQPAAAFGSNAQ